MDQLLNFSPNFGTETLLLLPVLVALEAVLSADNAIALAAIAQGLHDPALQRRAGAGERERIAARVRAGRAPRGTDAGRRPVARRLRLEAAVGELVDGREGRQVLRRGREAAPEQGSGREGAQ